MTADPNAPETGNGNETGKSKWEELGFDSEDAMIEAAKSAADLRSKISEAEAQLAKEKAAKGKTDADYLRQSNEIGDLRKKLKEIEGQTSESSKGDESKDDDELLESLTADEAKRFDDLLNDPKNAELKKKVVLGGKSAMAEFIKAYRTEVPPDLSASVFSGLVKKKTDSVPRSSIAKAVKELLKKYDQEEKNSLAATPPGGAPPDREAKAKKQMVTGGVGVDFFRKPE